MIATIIISLAVGFAAGYFVGSKNPAKSVLAKVETDASNTWLKYRDAAEAQIAELKAKLPKL